MRKKLTKLFVCFIFLFVLVGCTKDSEKEDEERAEKATVTVFFYEDTTDERKVQLQEEIFEQPIVLEVKYISAEEAWEEFQKEYFGEGEENNIEGNPLEDSDNFEVSVIGTEEEIEELVEYIKALEGVRKVNCVYQKDKELSDL